jgi:hypothetical protein
VAGTVRYEPPHPVYKVAFLDLSGAYKGNSLPSFSLVCNYSLIHTLGLCGYAIFCCCYFFNFTIKRIV